MKAEKIARVRFGSACRCENWKEKTRVETGRNAGSRKNSRERLHGACMHWRRRMRSVLDRLTARYGECGAWSYYGEEPNVFSGNER